VLGRVNDDDTRRTCPRAIILRYKPLRMPRAAAAEPQPEPADTAIDLALSLLRRVAKVTGLSRRGGSVSFDVVVDRRLAPAGTG